MRHPINQELEIKEKNLLIADFDSHVLGPIKMSEDRISRLKYHESWDWLMPVVAKIMRNINYYEAGAEAEMRHLEDVLPFAYIEDVHEAVYRFCKWWKANKD